MQRIDQVAAGPGVADVADVEHAPLALPQGRRPARRLAEDLPERRALLRRGNALGHGVQMLEAGLHLVERARQVEDHLSALPGDDPARGERSAVAYRLHVVDDRDVGAPGQQEVGVQRVHHPGDRDRPGRGGQCLSQHLATEDPLELGVRLAGPEEPDFDLLEVEQIDQLVNGLGHPWSLSSRRRSRAPSLWIRGADRREPVSKRAFIGRRRPVRRGSAARPVRRRRRLSGADRRGHPADRHLRWTMTVDGLVETPQVWTWDEMHALPASEYAGPHPLRDHVVQVRHQIRRGQRRHPARCRGAVADGESSAGHLDDRIHHQPALGACPGRSGLGGLELRRAAAAPRSRRPGPAARAPPVLLEVGQVDHPAHPARS